MKECRRPGWARGTGENETLAGRDDRCAKIDEAVAEGRDPAL
jgi:hypothetical protein